MRNESALICAAIVKKLTNRPAYLELLFGATVPRRNYRFIEAWAKLSIVKLIVLTLTSASKCDIRRLFFFCSREICGNLDADLQTEPEVFLEDVQVFF